MEYSALGRFFLIEPHQVFWARAVFVRRDDARTKSLGLDHVARKGQRAALHEGRVNAIVDDRLAQSRDGPLKFEAQVVSGVGPISREHGFVTEGIERRGPTPVATRGAKATH